MEEKKVYRVLIPEPINQKGRELLLEYGCELVEGCGPEKEAVMKAGKDCDAILNRNAILDKEVMDACPNLKVISMHGVGVDCIDVEEATKRGIQVTNAAQSNQSAVAEYTIGLILMLAKKSIDYNNGLKGGNMEVRKQYGHNVAGKTLGIIGMGNIGTQVAKMACFGLNMKVVGYNRHIEDVEKREYGTLYRDMSEVIRQADYLSLHLPGTAQTRHLIGKEQLALMKDTAYLINTGRGEVVDEAALIQVLQEKKIKGAALDVFEGNLPKPDNPLLSMPNVIVTPHTAAFTVEALERMAYQAALGIVETLWNKPISYPVNCLKETFEDGSQVTAVMDYFRHEFGRE